MLKLSLKMDPKSKQRPRFNGRFAYTDKAYRDWLTEAIKQFEAQYDGPTITKTTYVSIEMYGNSARSDIDNLSGSVLDAMVKAKVIKNDNLTIIDDLRIKWYRSKDPVIEIEISTTHC